MYVYTYLHNIYIYIDTLHKCMYIYIYIYLHIQMEKSSRHGTSSRTPCLITGMNQGVFPSLCIYQRFALMRLVMCTV